MSSKPQFRGASATRVLAPRRCLANIGGGSLSHRPDEGVSYLVTRANPNSSASRDPTHIVVGTSRPRARARYAVATAGRV